MVWNRSMVCIRAKCLHSASAVEVFKCGRAPVRASVLSFVAVEDWVGFKTRGDGEAVSATAVGRPLVLARRNAAVS